ncbi:hypothetical protein [Pleionea sediminis]|uniref:hypothetical protein n=1 Tax=Pleionea sediminis TaxID=2569479 RepID=UPI001186CE61|nr:hypothetical protein [Pleionea sediminis]
MHMTFFNANNFQAPRALYIAAWKVWFKRFSNDHYAWREGKIPLGKDDVPLHQLIEQGKRFSLEVLTRIMVPWSYRDTNQVTDDFIRMNPAVLRPSQFIDPESGKAIDAARLTDQALDYWDSMTYTEQDLYLNFAEARIQADIESPSDEPCILDDSGVEIIGEDIYPPVIPDASASDDEFIRAMVAWIDEDPFQPLYQKKPVGEAVSGWHDRLLGFFWPKPRTGYLEYCHHASPLIYRAGLLADLVESGKEFTLEDRELAIKTANEIFMFAGVPQREVTWQNVREVIETALKQNENSTAKMNSGWTNVASKALVSREGLDGYLPLMSWNSRVSSSVISRLDFLLVEAGVTELGDRFTGIGTIPGWGGTRPREYSLRWPSGYRSWKTIFAAGRIAEKIKDVLNNEKDNQGDRKYAPMPLAGGESGDWTTRGIQMVLFSDGY